MKKQSASKKDEELVKMKCTFVGKENCADVTRSSANRKGTKPGDVCMVSTGKVHGLKRSGNNTEVVDNSYKKDVQIVPVTRTQIHSFTKSRTVVKLSENDKIEKFRKVSKVIKTKGNVNNTKKKETFSSGIEGMDRVIKKYEMKKDTVLPAVNNGELSSAAIIGTIEKYQKIGTIEFSTRIAKSMLFLIPKLPIKFPLMIHGLNVKMIFNSRCLEEFNSKVSLITPESEDLPVSKLDALAVQNRLLNHSKEEEIPILSSGNDLHHSFVAIKTILSNILSGLTTVEKPEKQVDSTKENREPQKEIMELPTDKRYSKMNDLKENIKTEVTLDSDTIDTVDTSKKGLINGDGKKNINRDVEKLYIPERRNGGTINPYLEKDITVPNYPVIKSSDTIEKSMFEAEDLVSLDMGRYSMQSDEVSSEKYAYENKFLSKKSHCNKISVPPDRLLYDRKKEFKKNIIQGFQSVHVNSFYLAEAINKSKGNVKIFGKNKHLDSTMERVVDIPLQLKKIAEIILYSPFQVLRISRNE